MPTISYRDFSGGLDRRLPINEQEASKLWTLRNAYITQGKRIKKRPGLSARLGSFEDPLSGQAYKGLFSINGALRSYFATGTPLGLPPEVTGQTLATPILSGANAELVDVVTAVVFQGFEYVVAKWRDVVTSDTIYKHHYIDGVTGIITDANCPHSASITVAASRIFAIDGDVVRYCAAGNAANWTTASDAGFLAVGLQQNTTEDCTAVATFQDALVVFFAESAQIWDVAVDPSANKIRKRIAGVGTTAPFSPAAFFNDLGFFSPFGFRSMQVSSQTDRIDDNDYGSPIDALTVPDSLATVAGSNLIGQWIPQLGQYWCLFETLSGNSKAWVYTASRSSKIACWSEYTFPIVIKAICTAQGKVYVRSETTLYEFLATQYTDDGDSMPVLVQMAFQDAKTPGVDKMWDAADFSVVGSPSVSYLYDPRDETKETTPYTVTLDTRPGDLIPVEVVSPSLAPKFVHELNEAFEVNSVQLYFQNLKA